MSVANGGILTHPTTPRAKLNLDTMQPNLSYIDLASGKLLESFRPSHHQMSIRHLAVSQFDKVIIGMQYQGASSDKVPLVAFHQGESALIESSAIEPVQIKMKQYTASVAVSHDGNEAAITCPRGNIITLWDLNKNSFKRSLRLRDSAGASSSSLNGKYIFTSGFGKIQQLNHQATPDYTTVKRHPKLKWDNHLIALV